MSKNFQLSFNPDADRLLVQYKGDKKPTGYTQVDTFTHTEATLGDYGYRPPAGGDTLYDVVYNTVQKNKASFGMPDIVDMSKIEFGLDQAYTAVTALSISPATVTLAAKATQQITPTFTPVSPSNDVITYTSNSKANATVSATGLITAIATGKATVTATTEDGGYMDTTVVTVS